VAPPPRDMQLPILRRIVALPKERKEKAMEMGGKKGRGLIKAILAEHLTHFPWLTRTMLDHYILTYTDDFMVPKIIIAQQHTIVLGLTNVASPVRAATSAIEMSTVTSAATSANTPGSTTTSTKETVATTTSSKGGRPKGSMSSAAKAPHILIAEVTNECAIEIACIKVLSLEKFQNEGKTRRVPHGTFEKAISKVCEKYNLKRSEIKYYTVMSRNKKGHTLKVQHPGILSPMVSIEAHLFGIIMRCTALIHPISCAEGLELANSLIEGTALQICLRERKKKHLKMGDG
jgi:hypothetical protein